MLVVEPVTDPGMHLEKPVSSPAGEPHQSLVSRKPAPGLSPSPMTPFQVSSLLSLHSMHISMLARSQTDLEAKHSIMQHVIGKLMDKIRTGEGAVGELARENARIKKLLKVLLVENLALFQGAGTSNGGTTNRPWPRQAGLRHCPSGSTSCAWRLPFWFRTSCWCERSPTWASGPPGTS